MLRRRIRVIFSNCVLPLTESTRPYEIVRAAKKSLFGLGSPGLVVMGGDSFSKGREFESQCHILDGHIFTYVFVVKL